jgi:hypothetical protein
MERAKEPDPGLKASKTLGDEGAQVEVARSPVRCPYCHDACSPEDGAAIVCQMCLSRHHGACWREGESHCASCGSDRALQGAAPTIEVAPAELALIGKGLTREALERVMRRTEATETEALRALLEAAGRELDRSRGGLVALLSGIPPWALVIMMALMIPILAILLSR